jgi:hypothetical protein
VLSPHRLPTLPAPIIQECDLFIFSTLSRRLARSSTVSVLWPHPSVTLKLDFACCGWDFKGPGGQWMRVECTVAPADPGWAADERRRERLPLPRAYDRHYGTSLLYPFLRWFLNPIPDDDLDASTRHSCTPSARTGSRPSYFGPVPRSSSTSHRIHAASPESRRSSTRSCQGGVTLTFLPRCPRSIVRVD